MNEIMALAKQNDIYVIEYCAQAHGAKYDNCFVGSVEHFSKIKSWVPAEKAVCWQQMMKCYGVKYGHLKIMVIPTAGYMNLLALIDA